MRRNLTVNELECIKGNISGQSDRNALGNEASNRGLHMKTPRRYEISCGVVLASSSLSSITG